MRSQALIRPMEAGDWPEVAAIYQAGMDTGLATFESKCPDYETWDARHHAFARLVAEDAEGILGWAALSPVSARDVYRGVAEVSLYVDPHAQGMGIGTQLLGALLAEAEAVGVWTLQASILAENEASLRLHARCGFRQVGIRERLGRDKNGAWRDVVLMEKRNMIA